MISHGVTRSAMVAVVMINIDRNGQCHPLEWVTERCRLAEVMENSVPGVLVGGGGGRVVVVVVGEGAELGEGAGVGD